MKKLLIYLPIILLLTLLVSCGGEAESSEPSVPTIDANLVLPIEKPNMKIIDYAKNDTKKKIENKCVDTFGGAISYATYVFMKNGDLYGYGNNEDYNISPYAPMFGNIDKPYKMMSDVKRAVYTGVGTRRCIVLQNNGNLWYWGYAEVTPRKIADNVKDFHYGSFGLQGYLKNDDTLWSYTTTFDENGISKAENKKILDNVDRLTEYDNFVITKDGCLRELSGELIIDDVKLFYGPHPEVADKNSPAFVIKKDNTLWGWGNNEGNYLGVNDETKVIKTPVKIMDDVEKIYYESNVLALKTDKTLWGWGDNKKGQLGTGDFKPVSTPIKIMDNVLDALIYSNYMYEESDEEDDGDDIEWPKGNDKDYEPLEQEIYSTYAIKNDGSLYTWGTTYFKEIDTYGDHFISTPQRILDNVQSIKSDKYYGDKYIYALSDKNLLRWENTGWFSKENGELLYNSVEQILDDVISYESSYEDCNAIKSDNSLWGMGEKKVYKLLNGVRKFKSTGESYDDPRGLAITKNGALWLWEKDNKSGLKVYEQPIE